MRKIYTAILLALVAVMTLARCANSHAETATFDQLWLERAMPVAAQEQAAAPAAAIPLPAPRPHVAAAMCEHFRTFNASKHTYRGFDGKTRSCERRVTRLRVRHHPDQVRAS
jgi:hypothetical protein